MNIDERLEALTQSVELLVSMHNDHERHFEEHRKQFEERQKESAEHQKQFGEHQKQSTEHLKQSTEHLKQFAEYKRLVGGAIESIAETNRQLGENNRVLTQMLAGMRNEQQHDRQEFRDAMMRLSIIAEAHQDTLDDHEKRLGRPAA